jgi:hypothetical protein
MVPGGGEVAQVDRRHAERHVRLEHELLVAVRARERQQALGDLAGDPVVRAQQVKDPLSGQDRGELPRVPDPLAQHQRLGVGALDLGRPVAFRGEQILAHRGLQGQLLPVAGEALRERPQELERLVQVLELGGRRRSRSGLLGRLHQVGYRAVRHVGHDRVMCEGFDVLARGVTRHLLDTLQGPQVERASLVGPEPRIRHFLDERVAEEAPGLEASP